MLDKLSRNKNCCPLVPSFTISYAIFHIFPNRQWICVILWFDALKTNYERQRERERDFIHSQLGQNLLLLHILCQVGQNLLLFHILYQLGQNLMHLHILCQLEQNLLLLHILCQVDQNLLLFHILCQLWQNLVHLHICCQLWQNLLLLHILCQIGQNRLHSLTHLKSQPDTSNLEQLVYLPSLGYSTPWQCSLHPKCKDRQSKLWHFITGFMANCKDYYITVFDNLQFITRRQHIIVVSSLWARKRKQRDLPLREKKKAWRKWCTYDIIMTCLLSCDALCLCGVLVVRSDEGNGWQSQSRVGWMAG